MFLFTDVEGSTRLLHELAAEDYAEALAGGGVEHHAGTGSEQRQAPHREAEPEASRPTRGGIGASRDGDCDPQERCGDGCGVGVRARVLLDEESLELVL